MGNALFASMCLFSDYAGNKVIVLAILGKGLNVRSHIYIYIYGNPPLNMRFHRTLVERIPKLPNWIPLIIIKNMVSLCMLSCILLNKIFGFWRLGKMQKNVSPVNTTQF